MLLIVCRLIDIIRVCWRSAQGCSKQDLRTCGPTSQRGSRAQSGTPCRTVWAPSHLLGRDRARRTQSKPQKHRPNRESAENHAEQIARRRSVRWLSFSSLFGARRPRRSFHRSLSRRAAQLMARFTVVGRTKAVLKATAFVHVCARRGEPSTSSCWWHPPAHASSHRQAPLTARRSACLARPRVNCSARTVQTTT